LVRKGLLLKYIVASLFRVTWGFSLAVLLGVPFGLFLGWFRPAYQAFNPLIQVLRPTQENLARFSAFIDRWIIDALAVRGAGTATWGTGALARLIQVGNLQAYAFFFGLGIVVLIYFTVFR
jgi:hypothetical protein